MLAVAAILVFIWFYKSAIKSHKKNVWGWAALGVAAYYLSGIIWIYVILKPTLGHSFYNLTSFQGFLMEMSGIAIALAVVYLINVRFIRT